MRRYKSVKIRTKCAFCDMLDNAQTYRITQFQSLYLNKKRWIKLALLKKQYCYIITLINDDANNDNERSPDCQITGSPDYQIARLPDY